ncbi:MAG: biopolymer transporter ExbD [Pseudomonadota bacterium]
MKFTSIRQRRHFRIDITPLVDVVFTLLIFLMITTTFEKPNLLNIDLPKAASAKGIAKDEALHIIITLDGKYINKKNNKVMDRNELAALLKQTSIESKNKVIVIEADRRVSHGIVVRVMDMAKVLGLNRIGISTKIVE